MWKRAPKIGSNKPPLCSCTMRKGYIVLALAFFVTCGLLLGSAYVQQPGHRQPTTKLATGPYLPDALNALATSEDENPVSLDEISVTLDRSEDAAEGGAQESSCNVRQAELKVYMYDLPPEFHYGMCSGYKPEKGQIWPENAGEIPGYPGGLYQQHSPEYWLTTDLLTSTMAGRRNDACVAVRVDDWEDADVVFVPFFASLSYNLYTGRPKPEKVEAVDKNVRLQRKLVTFLVSQPAWKASAGKDHVIVMHHPNSMDAVREEVRNALFVVSDFGRYGEEVANIRKDVVAPYKHIIPTFKDDSSFFHTRTTLLFFQGHIVRKEGGRIRQELYELLKNEHGVHFTDGNTASEGFHSATAGMRDSKFCLNLAGDTPSSNRLFDSIVSHCVPVIISDDIELPFEDNLDYSKFAIFINSTKALKRGYVINKLRNVSSEEWTLMWKRLMEVERHFEYQRPALPNDAVNMVWKAIARRLPAINFAMNRERRFAAKPSRQHRKLQAW